MFSLTNLDHTFSTEKNIKFKDWETKQGEQWLISGTSGSGKTTLLHIIAGLLMPTKGDVLIADTLIYKLSASKADKFRGQNIGIVLQKPHLIDSLSVLDNLLLTQYLADITQNKNRVRDVLNVLQVSDKERSKTNTLSQGEAQRVAIARAVLNKPKIILADEPTASLDDINTEKVIELLKGQANESNATLIISTHDNRVKSHFSNIYYLN